MGFQIKVNINFDDFTYQFLAILEKLFFSPKSF